jgi:hypothetical protein
MKTKSLLLIVLVLFCFQLLKAQQDKPVHPSKVNTGKFIGLSKPLRDLPKITQKEFDQIAERAKQKQLNPSLKLRSYPFAATALPKGPDPVWQSSMGTKSALSNSPIQNFSGQTSPYYPPDCNGAAGPNHYMQTINCTYAIYNKTGTVLAGPTNMNLLFGSVTGSSYNDGDPIVLYDEQAQRFFAAEFSISGSNDYMLIAVSATSDPTGTWYQYSFDVADLPDYPKFGVWQDGYYMADNNSSGNDIYVFQRSVMLTGGASPQMVAFNNPYRPTSIDGFMCVPPVDNDGVAAPTGAPGTFIAINDDAIGGGSDQLWIYELAVNWTTPASSTFNRVQQLAVNSFDSNFGNDWTNITQPGTTQQLDAIPQVIMNAPQYRNFGTYQTIVCCHTVDVDATDHAGVRWYELRRGTQTSGNWGVRQQGTYAPDANSRWMGSVMLNGSGKIGLGYSISGSSVYPGIRYTGQSSSAYNSGAGLMDIVEQTIQTGSSSQTGAERWGDYSLMSVDPADDQTFWYTTEYISGSSRVTKIASFKFGNDPTAITLAASAVTPTTATLNGTVNPNGIATTYHFEWGTTTSYGNSTTTTSAGSGSSAVTVNAAISGLTSGTTYHFRLVAVNSDGTSNGSDFTFTPGMATVTTTTASAITMSTATSGGNVTSDGGLSVTARGVCWSTSANPTILGSHTTDASGTGTFTSSITGLSSSTLYHYRAYATNSSGTVYGDDLTFTTLCGTISIFPWNEGFENGGVIPNCWSQEQVSSSGIWFTFITGNGGSNPAAAHGGTYNACLKDANTAVNKTKLITPPINIAALGTPVLKFWHTQAIWSTRQDQLIVYYRTSSTGTWTTLATYTASITAWTQETINLPNQSADYYIAFEGNAKYGRGVCIDDVSITGISTPTLSVTPSTQSVTAAPGTTPFTVTSNSAWTASSNQTWCTVTPSGTGDGTITATYTQNTTTSSRSATITVTVTGLTPVTVTVSQAAPTLAVTPAVQSVTAAPGTTPFTVTSNSAWTATSNQTWCTVTPSGTGNGTVTATCTQNTTTSLRSATITVTVTGLTPVTVTVNQAAPTLSVLPSNQNVMAASGTTPFTVTSNSAWTVSSDQTWCTVTPSGTGNGTVTATYTANTLTTQRIANVTVTVSGVTPIVVTVTQAGAAPILSVTPSDRPVLPATGNTTFNVTSNTSWTASSDQTWCTVTPSGSGNGTITATYTVNNTSLQRVASITVTATGLTPIVVTVTQAAPTLSVTPSNQSVTYALGSTAFTVTSNTSWTVSSDQTWCTVTPSGSGNGTITANYTENTTFFPRIANVTVNVTGLTPIVVTVSQDAAPMAEFNYTIRNDVQTSDRTLEFDLYLLDTQPSVAMELSIIQAGILVNSGIIGGGTITTAIVTGYSDLNAAQRPTNALWATGSPNGCIKVTPKPGPGCGSGTIISTTGFGTRICRVRITNSVPFTASSQANLTFNFTTSPYPTKVIQYSGTPCSANELTTNGSNCFFNGNNPLLNLPSITVNLSLQLEGLYNGSATMRPAMDEVSYHWGATIADKLTVELHDGSNYSTVVYTVSDVTLNTNGSASFALPSSYNGSYYLTIIQRNHILTTTALPVSFAVSPVSYSFDAPAKAYGNNMVTMIDGTAAIFTGDSDQSGLIDGTDLMSIGNQADWAAMGYLPEDLNGDGLIDGSDLMKCGNNADWAVGSTTP